MQPRRSGIQLDMFAAYPAQPNSLVLMRYHRFANKVDGQLALAELHVAQDVDGRGMWSHCLNSRNGSGEGSRPYARFDRPAAATRLAALENAVVDMVHAARRATSDERARIIEWLGEQLSLARVNTTPLSTDLFPDTLPPRMCK
ncbi:MULTISPECIES: hypothetical protein [unclassified Pseudomonas]|uniref:hypothetical protein n=1 Tax=unclassified Pseudomonas TaxID=196821 RepID=UPI00131EA8D5|nr:MULTISPECIES: hypothetical protein [unclassified Pseudomonas]